MEFIKFLGQAALNGKQIVVYRDGDKIVVQPETVGFKPIRYQTEVDGDQVWRTCQTLRMTPEKYDEWEDSVIDPMNGAITVKNALIQCGYPAEAFV